MLYGSKSIYERALSLGIPSFLHAYDSYKHDLGLKVSPYKDTTVQLIADFFYQFIYPVKEEVPVIPSDSLKQMKIDLINISEEPKNIDK